MSESTSKTTPWHLLPSNLFVETDCLRLSSNCCILAAYIIIDELSLSTSQLEKMKNLDYLLLLLEAYRLRHKHLVAME
jgi:hypothetical protein